MTVSDAMQQWARMEDYSEEYADPLRSVWAKPTFLGVRAAQTWSDFYNWEQFLNAYPVASIVELGSWQGGFALFLLLQAVQRETEFATFDTAPCPAWDTWVAKALGLRSKSSTVDIFEDDGAHVRKFLDWLPKPALLFCDDGNKPAEVALFAPMLEPGDFLAVHDWGTEFNEPDLAPVASLLEPVFLDESLKVGTVTRWYRRV